MTHRHPGRECAPISAAHRAPRAAAILTLIAAWATVPGCGIHVLKHRAPAMAAEAQPKPSGADKKLVEVREQSALAPREPYWPYREAQVLLEADSLARAERALIAALERDPSYGPALSLLSRLYYDAGRHADAVERLEAARSRPGGDGTLPEDLLAGLALHYDAMNRPDLARAVMAQIPRPEHDATRSAAVYVKLRSETPDAATDLAAEAIKDESGSAVNQNNYGVTRLRAGDPAAARQAFLKAIQLQPRLPGPYYNLAILEKFYRFDDEAAARWYRAYRERSADDPDSLSKVFDSKPAAKVAGKED